MVNCFRDDVDKAPNIDNDWRNEETLKALGIVFRNKCYICERKGSAPEEFEVDHFIAQNENEDDSLKYEWTNLYLCCSDCNGSRKKKTPIGGYLDPCDLNDDVETEIVYNIFPYDYNQPVFTAANLNPSDKVKNTVEQLDKCHYGSKITKKKCASFRETIARQAKKLVNLMFERKIAIDKKDSVEMARKEIQIREMLTENAPFTMLMRSVANKYGYYDNT